MGASHSSEDDERHQNKELEKGKDHPDNKKLEADKEFKVCNGRLDIRLNASMTPTPSRVFLASQRVVIFMVP